MEESKEHTRNKGGRPLKEVKRSMVIGVRCSVAEQCMIDAKAKAAGLTKSEFLRSLGVNGKIDMRKKVIPNEVLQGIANLNHMAANLNQIAKKRNSFDELNALERAELNYTVGKVKQFVNDFRNCLK